MTEITATLNFAPGQSGTLTIHYESDIRSIVNATIPESVAVEELAQSTAVDSLAAVQNLGLQIQANISLLPVLDAIEPLKDMFDQLAKVSRLSDNLIPVS